METTKLTEFAHTYQRKDKEGTFHYSWYDEK